MGKKVKNEKNIISKIFNNGETYNFKELFIVMIFSLCLGFISCFSIFILFNGGRNYFSVNKDLNKFIDAYYAIVDNYYGDVDKNELLNNAISAMANSVGDEFTVYSDSDASLVFKETVDGIYEGIGCSIIQNADNTISVMEVFDDGPANEAGLKVGDVILNVNGKDIKEYDVSSLSQYIKTESESKIVMKILREGEEMTITITRGEVETPTVSSEVINSYNKKFGYISISIFSSVTAKQFDSHINKLLKENIDGLIIDVRGNVGGYLTSVDEISKRILKKGDIIYQLEKNGKTEVFKDDTKESLNIPIAILVNSSSASASEILASVIKESYNGYVVGTNTYGKGTVQQTLTLNDGSILKYTAQKWLTPNGNWINGVGVEPTNYVELSSNYIENPIRENDNQLQEAISLLNN